MLPLLRLLQVTIGNQKYRCSCVRYLSYDDIGLIVGLSVGLGLLLVIFFIIIIVSVACGRDRSKPAADDAATSINLDSPDRSHIERLPDGYIQTAMDRGIDSRYDIQLPDY